LNLAYALAARPPARSAQVASATPSHGAGDVEIAALIARLDQALGADGQLL
jgi:cell division protein ZapA